LNTRRAVCMEQRLSSDNRNYHSDHFQKKSLVPSSSQRLNVRFLLLQRVLLLSLSLIPKRSECISSRIQLGSVGVRQPALLVGVPSVVWCGIASVWSSCGGSGRRSIGDRCPRTRHLHVDGPPLTLSRSGDPENDRCHDQHSGQREEYVTPRIDGRRLLTPKTKTKKLTYRWQSARRICANTMAWLASKNMPLPICVTMPNLVVLR